VVPLPGNRKIPVELRGGGGPVDVDVGGIQITGGGDFLSVPREKQVAIIMSQFEAGLRGALAQSTAARVRGALI
jgi:hypothetical protein